MAQTEVEKKRERKIATAMNLDAMEITFTVKGYEASPILVQASEYSDEIFRHAVLHGLVQKLSDACAGEKDVSVVYQTLVDGAEALKNGWKVRSAGEGRDESLLTEAIAEFIAANSPDEATRATMEAKASDPTIRKALAGSKEVKEIKKRLSLTKPVTGKSAAKILGLSVGA